MENFRQCSRGARDAEAGESEAIDIARHVAHCDPCDARPWCAIDSLVRAGRAHRPSFLPQRTRLPLTMNLARLICSRSSSTPIPISSIRPSRGRTTIERGRRRISHGGTILAAAIVLASSSRRFRIRPLRRCAMNSIAPWAPCA